MSGRRLMLLAGLGSTLLLAGAFAFQAAGYAPCQMCLWQRWPHAVAAGLGALGAFAATPVLALGGASAALATAGLGAFHTGVERGWWDGPAACSGGGGLDGGLDGAALLSTEGAGRIVMCDEVAWSMAGLSMASWNALASLALAALWIAAFRRAVSNR